MQTGAATYIRRELVSGKNAQEKPCDAQDRADDIARLRALDLPKEISDENSGNEQREKGLVDRKNCTEQFQQPGSQMQRRQNFDGRKDHERTQEFIEHGPQRGLVTQAEKREN